MEEKTAKKVLVRAIVSKGKESIRTQAMLSGILRKGDELVVDDEATGEAYPVKITSLEVGDKRLSVASADEIKTLWARAVEEVVVKISVSRRETTESMELHVPGEREFVVGETVGVNGRELKIKRIKIRDGGFKSRKGAAVKAKDVRRIYADSGSEPRRISGERVMIKRRRSVWSLKSRGTG